MKKILSAVLVLTLILGTVFTLVSCGLSGTYEGKLFDLKFSGSNVTVIAGDNKLKGTYEIDKDDDGNKTISFDFIDEDEANSDEKYVLNLLDALLGGEISMSEKDGELKIGYLTFKKK